MIEAIIIQFGVFKTRKMFVIGVCLYYRNVFVLLKCFCMVEVCLYHMC